MDSLGFEMAQLNIDLSDLTNSALKRLVTQLLTASESEERKIMQRLAGKSKPGKNDLADLDEEMHGKPNTPEVEDDSDPFDLNNEAESDEESDMPPKKKGKK
jgi:hypothetical protein